MGIDAMLFVEKSFQIRNKKGKNNSLRKPQHYSVLDVTVTIREGKDLCLCSLACT